MLVTLYRQLIQTQEKLGESEAALQAALQHKEGGQTSQPPPETINLDKPPQATDPPTQQAEQAAPSTSATVPPTEQAPSLDMQKMKREIELLEEVYQD